MLCHIAGSIGSLWQERAPSASRRIHGMSDTIDVLLINGSAEVDSFWQKLFAPTLRESFRVEHVRGVEAAVAALPSTPFDAILLDHAPAHSRKDLEGIHANAPEIPIILITSK